MYGAVGLKPWELYRLTPREVWAMVEGRRDRDRVERQFEAGLTGLILSALTGKQITADKIIPQERAEEIPWGEPTGTWTKIDRATAEKLLAQPQSIPPGW